MPTALVMETTSATDYRLERWIALVLSLLFFLPFVAGAQESPIVSTNDVAPVRIDGSAVRWSCKAASVEGFRQCALLVDEHVVTWRMATDAQELRARVGFEGETLRVQVSRAGGAWQPVSVAPRPANRSGNDRTPPAAAAIGPGPRRLS